MDIEPRVAHLSDLLGQLLNAEPISFSHLVPSFLPPKPGVYRIFETALPFDSVYVGRTESLTDRLYGSHLMGNQSVSTLKKKLLRQGRYLAEADVKAYLRHDCSLQFLLLENTVERQRLEHFAIAVLRPWYNN